MAAAQEAPMSALEKRLSEVPSRLVGKVRSGYSIISRLPEEKRRSAVAAVFTQLAQRNTPSSSDFEKQSGVAREDASDALLAVTVTFAALVDLDVDAESFLKAASSFYDEGDSSVVSEMAGMVVSQRSTLSTTLDEATLAASVLPSLVRFDIELDIRIRFDNQKFSRAVPVIVAHLGSDGEGQDAWVQLTRADAEMVIDKLTKAVQNMEAAESLISDMAKRGAA